MFAIVQIMALFLFIGKYWLCSDEYNNTNRKSQKHIEMLWELHKWNDGRR